MRTTLTLENDVVIAIERIRRAHNRSLKDIVNQALREGLRSLEAKPEPSAPFRTETVSLGRCLIGDLEDVAEALAIAEGEMPTNSPADSAGSKPSASVVLAGATVFVS